MRLILRSLVLIVCLIFTNPLFAQFGKNKVQYDKFDWKFISSKHFDVYYNSGSKSLAEFTAVSAEGALISIQKTLNFRINNRITVIVYDSHNEFQQTNVIGQFMPEGVGGVTELYKNRVVLPFQGDYEQYDHVIHHELVHAVLNDMFYGGNFQSAMTNSSSFQIPTWMNEGFAEWESIGGLDTETDMFMRDLTISEKLPSLERLDGYTAYRAGQTFYWYIGETYGKGKVGEFFNRLKIYRNLDATFKSCFNMNFEDFSEKFEKEIKKIYWPDLTVFEDPKDFAVPITNHVKDESYYNSSPAISPNGEKMAYISALGGMYGVYIRELNEKDKKKNDVRKLISSFRAQDFEDLNMLTPGISWSPDGKQIAISAKSGGEDAIFLVDEKSGDYEKILLGLKSISSVHWAYDGKKIAFIATKRDRSDVFVYDLKSKKTDNLTNDSYSEKVIVWSHDSKSIYFISDRGNDLSTGKIVNMKKHDFKGNDIYKIEIANSQINRLTVDFANTKTSIAISADNSKLFYVSDKNGIGNVYLMDLTTLDSKILTNSITGITQISLANDNSKLLFSSQIKGGYDIFMLRYPLEIKAKTVELPLTQFKKKQIEEFKILESVETEEKADAEKEKINNYGNFEIDFTAQQVVSANPEVIKDKLGNFSGDTVNSDQQFIEKDYKISLSADIIQSNPGYSTYYGFQGVAQMLFSDVLGDHQIYVSANLWLDLNNSQLNVSYYYLPKIIDYGFSIYHNSVITEDNFSYLYRYRYFGLNTSATLPFNLFNRLGFEFSLMNASKEPITDVTEQTLSKLLVLPKIEYVHDNTLWGLFAPRDGSRYNISLLGSPKIGSDGLGFISFETDYRLYIPIGDYFGFAYRASGAASFGANPQTYFLGGIDNWFNRSNRYIPFNNPEDFVFLSFKTPMRGWSLAQLTGNKYFVSNFEFRFPLLTALVAGPLPVFIYGIMGNIFFDIGGAWNDEFVSVIEENGEKRPGNLLMSTGLGARAAILGMPFKFDVAWTNGYSSWSEPQYLFSLGLDF